MSRDFALGFARKEARVQTAKAEPKAIGATFATFSLFRMMGAIDWRTLFGKLVAWLRNNHAEMSMAIYKDADANPPVALRFGDDLQPFRHGIVAQRPTLASCGRLQSMPWPAQRPFLRKRGRAVGLIWYALMPRLLPRSCRAGRIQSRRRFYEERKGPALHVPDQPDGSAYIVLDKRTSEMFTGWPHFASSAPGVAYAYLADYKRNRRDIFITRRRR